MGLARKLLPPAGSYVAITLGDTLVWGEWRPNDGALLFAVGLALMRSFLPDRP